MDNCLSVLIPTYNRKERLICTLKALSQQTRSDFSIIISDNCSPYEPNDVISTLPVDFQKRVKIEKNSFNVGATANIVGLFLKARTKWVWLLSDDDSPEIDSVEKIYQEINLIGKENVGVIHFPVFDMEWGFGERKDFTDLEEYIDYYWTMLTGNNTMAKRGDLIFLSNKVYNMDVCSYAMEFTNMYSHTRVSQLLPMIKILYDRRGSVRYVDKRIVKYLEPENDHWNVSNVVRGMSCFSLVPLEHLNPAYRKKLNYVIALDDKYVRECYLNHNVPDKEYLKKIYSLMYKDILSFKKKMIFRVYIFLSANKSTFRLLKYITRR